MMELGRFHHLTVKSKEDSGFLLASDWGEVYLPSKEAPAGAKAGDVLEVFLYKTDRGQLTATTGTPAASADQFAYLKVVEVGDTGVFFDWGLPRALLTPNRELAKELRPGEWSFVRVCLNPSTGCMMGSTKISKFIEEDHVELEPGEETDLLIFHETDLGYKAIINHHHMGMLYHNEVFKKLEPGDRVVGYVKKVREDNRIDLCLTRQGYREAIIDTKKIILDALKSRGGFLPLTDKSSPEDIAHILGMSKKNFKKGVGLLYKNRVVRLEKDGIHLIDNQGGQ